MPKVVISLLTYNSEQHCARCLMSIATQTFRDTLLVCRDNNSSDKSVEMVTRLALDARVIAQKVNDGFSRGHNTTIRETRSDYVCILNPDLVLDAEYLAECVSFLDAHPRVGAVSGLLARMKQLTDGVSGGIIDSSGIYFSKTGRATNMYAGKPVSFVTQPLRVIGVAATAALYRRTALEDTAMEGEYFDEDFFMYKEDVDMALRLKLRGWEAYTLPSARAWHVRSTDQRMLVRPSSFINRLSYRNHWFVLVKSVPREYYLRYGLFIAFFEMGKFVYLLFTEFSTLAALGDVRRMAKKICAKRAIIMARRTSTL